MSEDKKNPFRLKRNPYDKQTGAKGDAEEVTDRRTMESVSEGIPRGRLKGQKTRKETKLGGVPTGFKSERRPRGGMVNTQRGAEI